MFYSCFVGHLPQTVKKEELYTLFSGCGDVQDIFVCDDRDTSSYNYGFVRFKTGEQALKAVEELNKWPIHGTPMIVDIAKDTAKRIKEEKKLNNDRMVQSARPCSPPRSHVRCDKGKGSAALVQDIMYLSRLKETCASLNYKVNSGLLGDEKTKTLNVDKLLDNIASQSLERVKTAKGEFIEDITPEKIRDRLLQSDRKSCSVDISKTTGFIKALQTVVGTMSSFLQEGAEEPNLNLINNRGGCQDSHQHELGTSVNESSNKQLQIINTNTEQKGTKLSNLLQTLPVLENSKDVRGTCVSVSHSVPVLQHSNSEEVEETSNSDSDCEGPSRDSGIESDALSAKNHNKASVEFDSSICFDDQSKSETKISNEEKKSCERITLESPEKMDDCAIIESYLQNALKIGKNTEQPRESNDGRKTKEDTIVEHACPVPIGRGAGRGILGIMNK